MRDSDNLVSPAASPYDYSGPESLIGKEIGIVLGYQYPVIEQDLASGRIKRLDVETEEQIVMMVAHDRLKVGLIPETAARYFTRQPDIRTQVHISARPLYSFDRRVLMHGDAAWLKFLLQAANNAPHDPAWQGVLQRYGLIN